MANQEHLNKLNEGVKAWNQWRSEYQNIKPELSHAELIKANLSYADLSSADLSHADLYFANIINAELTNANVSYANLANTQPINAHFINANLSYAELINANLSYAELSYADLRGAVLTNANLSYANLSHSRLTDADLGYATVASTTFGKVDLSEAKGLDMLRHDGPSTIGIDTIYLSHGNIPEVFLRKAGVPEPFITNMRALVASMSPLDFYSCFISYSSRDHAFAERLYADLQSKGVRCWFAPEDMKIGDKLRPRIDESIRLYDKLLLVLSTHSIASSWVEHEVEMALAKEQKEKRPVLFPVRLDEAIIEMEQDGWPSEVRHTRHIGNFTRWKNHDEYQKAFERLLRDLKQASS